MPLFAFNLAACTHSSPRSVFSTQDQCLKLRRYNALTGRYDPIAALDQAGSIITTEAMPSPNFKEVFSISADEVFRHDASGAQLGTLLYRISLDGGATYYYWDTDNTVWAVASTSAHFSTLSDLRTMCLSLPLPTTGSVSPRMQIKILPDSTGTYTPLLEELGLHVEVYSRPYEDAARSVLRHLKDKIRPVLAAARRTVEAATTITIAGVWTPFTIVSVTAVYDLTNDPGRRNNLYSSFANGVVTLTDEVAADIKLEVQYVGSCPVTPLAEDTYVDGTIPNVGVMPRAAERDDGFSNFLQTETNKEANFARLRVSPDVYRQRFRCYAVAARNEDAFQIAHAVIQAVEVNGPVQFLPTGEQMTLCYIDHYDSLDFEPRGLYSKQVEFEVQFRDYRSSYEQVPLVRYIGATVTDTAETLALDTAEAGQRGD